MPEARANPGGIREPPDRMIRKVESFEAKLQFMAFLDFKVLECGKIPANDAWPDERVASHVPKRAKRLQLKGVRVKETLRILLPARESRLSPRFTRPVGAGGRVGYIEP